MTAKAAAVATIGVFDGFHRGHAAVVARARERARRAGSRLVLFTFDAHPRAVLAGAGESPQLTLLGEKIALLRAAGGTQVRVLAFTPELAALSPLAFLERHVFPSHPLAALVLGYDFAMGRERSGTIPALERIGRTLGFDVEGVPPVLDGGEPISSTRIRGLLLEGAVEAAARLLGAPYRIAGTVGRGDGRGMSLGFPTANLVIPARKLQPARGVYAVRVSGAGFHSAPGVVNLGARPTFGGGDPTVEVHLLDFEGELRGARLALSFIRRLREERKFADAKELAGQIGRDAAAARALLAGGDTADNPA